MSNQTPTTRFGDLFLEPIRNGIYKSKEFHGRGQKVVNMGELFAFDFISDQPMKRVELNENELEKSLLRKYDLLFARRSLVLEGSGKCSLVLDVPEDTTYESSIIRVRMDPDKANPIYYYYYFISPMGRNNVISIASQTAVSGITGSNLGNLMVPFPAKEKQDEIAEKLFDYDKLIAVNAKKIKCLEDIAQKLYTEWFVNFKFPGHEKVKMVDSGTEFGMIPKGWEVENIGDLISRVPTGKKYDSKTALQIGNVPILDQGKSGIIGYHNGEASVNASEDNPVIVFANHTCYQNLIVFPFSTIQNVLPFRPNDDLDIYWTHYATKDIISFSDYKGHWPEYIAKKIVIPSKSLTCLFGEIIRSNYLLKNKLEIINNNLSKLREQQIKKLFV